MIRPLVILTEGRLSPTQLNALRLLSLGYLDLVLAPSEVDEIRRRRSLEVIVTSYPNRRIKEREEENERIRKEDEEIFSIISTFMSCQN